MNNNKTLVALAAVFVALFSYWTYNQITFYRAQDTGKAFDSLPDTSSASTENTTLDSGNAAPSTTTVDSTAVWTATDYHQGDIAKGDYTVTSGDTLWEIAEAVYGDGTQWVTILAANATSVGYLPNGQQALIFPGQVLVLP
jgi:nucleoid-associated protein YgaU